MMESCVPPGFRFHPTDEELVGYYLRKKVASQKIDLDVIREIDLYRIEPWDLQERCRIGYEEQNEWYFFSHKDKKYPTGTRTNRATMAGFWKATGRDKAVYDKAKLIGMRKTLVFYKGRAPNGQKTDWIMHEYRLESDDNNAPPQEEGWVVCRAFKKRTNSGQTKAMVEGWDPSYLYEEASGVSSTVVDHLISSSSSSRHHQHLPHHQSIFLAQTSFMCKQETDHNNNSSLMHGSDDQHQFIQQLPQLQSPTLPLVKSPPLVSTLVSQNNHHEDDQSRILLLSNNNNNSNCNNNDDNNGSSNRMSSSRQVVTADWRDLDKFVASQLMSQGDHGGMNNELLLAEEGLPSFETSTSDMALLLLQHQNSNEGNNNNNKLSPFLSAAGSDCDIGICVFEK